jgi:hypothetical protein
MVSLVIYLKKDFDPVELVEKLLNAQLIASVSLDQKNESLTLQDGILSKQIYNVITAQTKSLLFAGIAKMIEGEFGPGVPVNATPIVASNKIFEELFKARTLTT